MLLKVIDALFCAILKLGNLNEIEQMKFLLNLETFDFSAKLDSL